MKERVNPEVREAITNRLNLLIGNYNKGISGFAESIGVTRDDVNNWLLDKSDMRLSALVAIAEKYHVSTDYILGLSPYSSPDTSIQGVEKTTGLNREAIENLIDIHNLFDAPTTTVLGIELLSKIFSSEHFISLVSCFKDLALMANDIENHLQCISLATTKEPYLIDMEKFELLVSNLEYGRYSVLKACNGILDDLCANPVDDTLKKAKEDILEPYSVEEAEQLLKYAGEMKGTKEYGKKESG